MAERKLVVEILGDTKSLDRAFDHVRSRSSKLSRSLGATAKGIGLATAGIGGGIAFGLKKSIDSANEHAKALAQTQAVIKSTGGAANVTAKQITDLANAIEKKTGVDDLAIQSGENLLATFTGIRNEAGKGNDIFTRATKTIADMSTALGQDTKASAIQLGKALNDPIKGVTALQRIGVSFTEGQKKQIKALTDSGHKLEAQKLILRELNKEFGGSAEAAGKTLPGQLNILKARLDDVAQRIGEKLVPALTDVVEWVTEHWPQISRTVDQTFTAISRAWTASKPTFDQIVAAARQVVAYIREHWPEISARIKAIFKAVHDVFVTVWPLLRKIAITNTKAIVRQIEAIATAVQGVSDTVRGISQGDWSKSWGGFRGVAKGALMLLKADLKTQIEPWFMIAKALGNAIKRGIVAGLRGLARLVAALIKMPINAVIDSINAVKLPAWHVDTHIPGVGKIGSPAIDPIPKIPRLAEGGIVRRPTLALVGERGPEAVIPLGSMQPQVIHLVNQLIVDGRVLAEIVTNHQNRTARRHAPRR